jgi:peptide/nickel transport system ATP-binding protein/oligopeptide transport system ATP-binding protein
MEQPLLQVQEVKKHFPLHGGVMLRTRGSTRAVDGVSLEVGRGETLGLVGESGCGKTTLGRCIMALYPLTAGRILFDGVPLTNLSGSALKAFRLRIQMIFQDPFESLNARHTVREILEEKFRIHGRTTEMGRDAMEGILETVGLSPRSLLKFPHEFSGGQRQRIGIARAVSLHPELIVCDEPVSALDVSVQSQILNLLLGLQETMGLTYVFISHDLSVVRHMSDRIAVMYLGRIVETASSRDLYAGPLHPYTQALLSAIPLPDPGRKKRRILLRGEVPSAANPPPGCRFHTRCPHVLDLCRSEVPELEEISAHQGHRVACHRVGRDGGFR